jgi:glutaredoxin 3
VYLRQQGIPFEEKDINQDLAARQEFERRGLRGVPSFLIGNEVVAGLDRQKIQSLLAFNVFSCPTCQKKLRVPRGKGKIRVTCPECKSQSVQES